MPLKLKGNMKKFIAKVRQSTKKQPQEPQGRITTDTLAEHREKVLAGGRKFKYPVQYQRHRLVINAVIIGVSALVVLIGLGWYLLYPAQNTSEFMYRVTKVVPVPVAVVDGEPVRYSDYLMQYRSQVHYLTEKEQLDINSEDGKRQLEYVKSQSMNEAVADAYASKLARQQNIEVTDADLETFLTQQRQASDGEVSEATYNSVIEDYYGWSPDEYRDAMRHKLLRQKVGFAIDSPASNVTDAVEQAIAANTTDLQKVASDVSANSEVKAQYTPATWVPLNNRDGGLALAAAELGPGQISTAIQTTSGNGYYYVKLIEKNDTQLQYEYILVPLTQFTAQLKQIQQDRLNTFITVEELQTTQE
jgi:hypothetical protein